MAYPEKVTDLKPDQLVSDPVVFIDYDLFPGLPAEAQEARKYEWASLAGPEADDLFERLTLHEVNAWAIRENKPLIEL